MWREPTTADLRAALLEDELLSWQTVSVAEGTDPVAKAIDDAVGRFRTALRSGYKGTMGADRTLPHDLIPQAMHAAAFYYLGSRAGAQVSQARADLYKDAIHLAERIEDGRLHYTEPDDEETSEDPSDAAARPSVTTRTLTLSRARQAGI